MTRIKSRIVAVAAHAALLVFMFARGAGAANCPPDDEVNLRWTTTPPTFMYHDFYTSLYVNNDHNGGTYSWSSSNSALGQISPINNDPRGANFSTASNGAGRVTISCTYTFEDEESGEPCSYSISNSIYVVGAEMFVDSNHDGQANASDNATEDTPGAIVGLGKYILVYLAENPTAAGGTYTLKLEQNGGGQVSVFFYPYLSTPITIPSDTGISWSAGTVPDFFRVFGTQVSQSPEDVTFGYIYTPPSGSNSQAETDTVSVAVLEVDLDVDSNNNGLIEDTDDDIEFNSPGMVLGVGKDKDLSLSLTPNAFPPDSKVQLWVYPRSSISIYDTNTEIIGPSLSDIWTQELYGSSGLPESFSMRGVSPGQVQMALNYWIKNDHQIASDKVLVTVVDVDLAVDSNNDGYIWSDDNEIEEDSGTLGLLICKNDDHDNGYQDLPDCDNEVLENYPDTLDCGIMELSLMPSGLPNGSVVELSVNDSSKVRIFRYAADPYQPTRYNISGWDAIIGPPSGSSWTRTLSAAPYPSLEYFLIEGVNPGLVEITVIYKIPNGSGGFIEVSRDKVRTTILSVDLKELEFKQDNVVKNDAGTAYSGADWQDNDLDEDVISDTADRRQPVSYKRDEQISVAAKWEVAPTGLDVSNWRVRGTGPDGIKIGFVGGGKAVTLAGSTLSMAETTCDAGTKLPNTVKYYSSFEIAWELSLDGGATWPCSADKSDNLLYVTYAEPQATMYHTLLHIGSFNADGETIPETIVTDIWGEFADRSVKKVDPKTGALVGNAMTYYKTPYDPACPFDVAGLLENEDGRCGAWARLMRDVIKLQGVPNAVWKKIVITPQTGLTPHALWVKNQDLTPLSATPPSAPTPLPGIPGQGTGDPSASIFENHAIVTYGSTIYDPSYGGQPFSSLTNWQQSALDAISYNGGTVFTVNSGATWPVLVQYGNVEP